MKHLLLIANLDGTSVPLLRYASRMCKQLNLRLHILKLDKTNDPVILSSPYYYNKYGLLSGVNNKTQIKEQEVFVAEHTKDIIETSWVSNDIRSGNIDECLKKFINEQRIDMVITRLKVFKNAGAQENELIKKILLNVADIPTLLIPENISFKELKKFKYFTTFSQYDLNNIEWLMSNFEGSSIDLIHSSNKELSIENKRWINYIQDEISKKITFSKIETPIKQFLKEFSGNNTSSEVLCFSTRKRSFWEKLIDPSTTLHLLGHLDTQCLILKYKVMDE